MIHNGAIFLLKTFHCRMLQNQTDINTNTHMRQNTSYIFSFSIENIIFVRDILFLSNLNTKLQPNKFIQLNHIFTLHCKIRHHQTFGHEACTSFVLFLFHDTESKFLFAVWVTQLSHVKKGYHACNRNSTNFITLSLNQNFLLLLPSSILLLPPASTTQGVGARLVIQVTYRCIPVVSLVF